ncbi:MAG: HAMP domain-containing protein, partial [Deltaproteobacteria bacterium]|nr:HAMP domain-containing protein [Deltaproteobacteria bacterium]
AKGFKTTFIAVAVLSLAMVVLLSVSQIRKNTVPLDILQGATRRIAEGDFDCVVQLNSGDEFQDLAQSFNEMSGKLKETQALLVQTAKMSTMGQMAAGIVHEIKQPLTAIYGLLQLARLEMPSGKSSERLETMEKALDRLNGILMKFRSFSQKSDEKHEPLSLKLVVKQVYELLEHQMFMKKVECVIEHEDRLPLILGNDHALQQVISNLLINAMDALEETREDRRKIVIRSFSSNGEICLAVEDNGSGIPEEKLEHIFEPFFTTKDPEKGTGLGLAIISSILHKHQARIEVRSKIGEGTVFTIRFPSSSDENTS